MINETYCPRCKRIPFLNIFYNGSLMVTQTAWVGEENILYRVCTNCGYIDVDEEYREAVEELEAKYYGNY